MSLVVITRFKNESHIMYEFINHYLLEEVDCLILIDDNSDDDYLKKNQWLNKLINNGKVIFKQNIENKQLRAYNPFINEVKKYDWVICCDMDEFIFSVSPDTTLKSILNTKYSDIDYIRIRWKIFIHTNKFQPKSVIENNIITHKSDKDNLSIDGIKCIAKTQYLTNISIHSMKFNNRDLKIIELFKCHNNFIQINHYRTQSDEYLYGVKEVRGGGVHKHKYEQYTNHTKYHPTKHCFLLQNKRTNLITQLNNKIQILPKIYTNSSFYMVNHLLLEDRKEPIDLYIDEKDISMNIPIDNTHNKG